MKKTLLALGLVFGCFSVHAQISIPDSYYINRAKKQLEAEEARKIRKLIVIGTVDGKLSYVIRDGKRQTYGCKDDGKIRGMYWKTYVSPAFLPPLLPQPEQNDRLEHMFALLLDELCRDRWILLSVSGNSESAVYVFEKMEKK